MKTVKLKHRLRLLWCLVILQCIGKHLTALKTSLPPQLQEQRLGQGAQAGGGWELLGSPSISRMGLGPCWMMLTHALHALHAQLAPLLEERSMWQDFKSAEGKRYEIGRPWSHQHPDHRVQTDSWRNFSLSCSTAVWGHVLSLAFTWFALVFHMLF